MRHVISILLVLHSVVVYREPALESVFVCSNLERCVALY